MMACLDSVSSFEADTPAETFGLGSLVELAGFAEHLLFLLIARIITPKKALWLSGSVADNLLCYPAFIAVPSTLDDQTLRYESAEEPRTSHFVDLFLSQ